MLETKDQPNEEEKPVADGRWIMRKQRIVKDDGRSLIFYDFEEPDRESPSPPSESRNPQ